MDVYDKTNNDLHVNKCHHGFDEVVGGGICD